jgi:hypothetical protein
LARAIADNYAGVLPELDIRDLTPSQHVLAYVVFGRGTLMYERDRASRASAEARIVEEHLDTQWLRDSYRRYRRRHDAA